MNGLTSALANTKIDQMLTACEDAGLCGCSGLDSDNDGTPDQCDDCLNLAGDVNDDLTIDILDIIGTVNIILNGGINSSSYTDCEKEDADYNSDQIINVLDIISIINNILGSRSLDIVGTAEVIIETLGNDTHIKIISDAPYSGVELSMITENNPNITLKDNSHISGEYLTIDNVTKLVAYSIVNKPFDGFTTEFIIENENIKADELIALIGSTSGHELEISLALSTIVLLYSLPLYQCAIATTKSNNPVNSNLWCSK
jgi:hypothetical protein